MARKPLMHNYIYFETLEVGSRYRLMAAVDYFNDDPVVHTWTYKLDKAA